MKRGLLTMLIGIMLVLMASQVFAAAGYRHAVLFPRASFTAGDSTATTTWLDAANWFDWRGEAIKSQFSGMRLRVYVAKNDADIDSISIITRLGDDGKTSNTIDSSEITGSTLLSGMSKTYTADSAYWFSNKMISYAVIYGDAAGTAVQTITLHVVWDVWDKFNGQWKSWKEHDIEVGFQE